MNKLSNRSKTNINKINPHLSLIIGILLSEGKYDLTITDGYRSVEDQQSLYAKGRTTTGNIVTKCDGINKKSYHQSGKAIDFIPYPFDGNWNNIEQFTNVGNELERIGKELGYKCSYGGNWKSFKDYPHFQID